MNVTNKVKELLRQFGTDFKLYNNHVEIHRAVGFALDSETNLVHILGYTKELLVDKVKGEFITETLVIKRDDFGVIRGYNEDITEAALSFATVLFIKDQL